MIFTASVQNTLDRPSYIWNKDVLPQQRKELITASIYAGGKQYNTYGVEPSCCVMQFNGLTHTIEHNCYIYRVFQKELYNFESL
jgi:hypothetical protein